MEKGGVDGDEACTVSQDGPMAFLGRRSGMIEVATDAKGALVSLAADLVAQVRGRGVRGVTSMREGGGGGGDRGRGSGR